MPSKLAIIATVLFFAFGLSGPVAAQLIGTDTAPGSSCVGVADGATRMTADADLDGASVVLVCDGTIWNTQGVKVSNDTAACDASKDGTIRYNSGGSPQWAYCDGGATTWRPFEHAGGCSAAPEVFDAGGSTTAIEVPDNCDIATIEAWGAGGGGGVGSGTASSRRAGGGGGGSGVTRVTGVGSVPTSGLAGHWTLNDTAANTTVIAAVGADGTMTGGMTGAADTVAGMNGTALDFDGNDSLNLGSAAGIDDIFTAGGTVSAWVHQRNIDCSGDRTIITKWGAGLGGWEISIGNGTVSFGVAASASGESWWSSNTTISCNDWVHIALSYDSNSLNTAPVLYFNGTAVSITQDETGSGSVLSDAAKTFFVGEGEAWFTGYIDDVRLYNVTLTAQEVQDLYNGTGGGAPVVLVGAGGGGGGGGNTSGNHFGGGGGGYASATEVAVTPSESLTVYVGAGGASGCTAANNGDGGGPGGGAGGSGTGAGGTASGTFGGGGGARGANGGNATYGGAGGNTGTGSAGTANPGGNGGDQGVGLGAAGGGSNGSSNTGGTGAHGGGLSAGSGANGNTCGSSGGTGRVRITWRDVPLSCRIGDTGYFVLTQTTYNGGLGGFVGANSQCLAELTTNTNWQFYDDANDAGMLTADNVRAFLCYDSSQEGVCQSPALGVTYYFARVGDVTAGGASFTMADTYGAGVGFGPNDAANWSGATYFNGNYSYWAARYGEGVSSSRFPYQSWSVDGACVQWTVDDDSETGDFGTTNSSNDGRWHSGWSGCGTARPLICMVTP